MNETLDILMQNIRQDPISMVFTQVITLFFFIGAIPGLAVLAGRLLNQMPLLHKITKNPLILIASAIVTVGLGIYVDLQLWALSLIVLIFICLIMLPRLSAATSSNPLSISPSLLTTVGVLGTFVGIYIGLNAFDINNIDGSIPGLLKGLKVAFTTSIVGMVAAIALKFVQSIQVTEADIGETKEAQEHKKEKAPPVFDNIHKTLEAHLEQSKRQHIEALNKIQNNTETQSKLLQLLYSKVDFFEGSLKHSNEDLHETLNKIARNTSNKSESNR